MGTVPNPFPFLLSDHVASTKRWSHQLAPSRAGVPSSTDDIAVFLPQWPAPSPMENSHWMPSQFPRLSVQILSCSLSIITTTAAAAKMPPKMPLIDDLLVLLEVFFAPEKGGLPGGTATKAELDFAEKDSPVKGEDVKPGPWPGGSSPDSVRDDGSAAIAGASSSSSPPLSFSSSAPAAAAFAAPCRRLRRSLPPPSPLLAAAAFAAVLGGFAACCRRRRCRRLFWTALPPPFFVVFFFGANWYLGFASPLIALPGAVRLAWPDTCRRYVA
ncbi:hypothetical protein Focb16_v002338 [Fusarium oxysporum f. sp. cubense]|uniref:Uncharacterized protein n=1 Tax=Fusarium oxysporum f. sp. cubense TaxID=61366 RepID=A0A559L5V7_FUSOC|nr:hypothetical protein Focb16_v002338 [Fusarium oxysporum f. sp. cubense]